MGFNVVVLSGRLTADPEIRMGTNDTKIARYTLAVDREKRKNTERKADFIPCVALGKNAEFVEKFLKKGMKIKWQTGSYTNQNGEKIYTNDCFVESHDFAENKGQTENPQKPDTRPVPPPEPSFMDVPDLGGMEDEFPFS
jgi:single-strand DNA-binding protein